MRRFLPTVLILPLVCHAAQQTPTLPAPKGSIEGVILRADTGEPLRKAWVTLHGARERGGSEGALSDTSGRFSLKDIEPGQYTLTVERNGFVRQSYGQRGPETPGTTLSISPGQTLRDIEIRLTPAAAISGHVYDEDGEPVEAARVSALRYSYHEGQRKLQPWGVAATNDLGEYRLFGLAPGRYFLSAVLERWGRPPVAGGPVAMVEADAASGEMAYAPTYFPGVNDVARAAALEVRSGDDMPGYDISLLPTRSVRVRGRILNLGTGKAVRRAMVAMIPREGAVRFHMPSAQSYVDDAEGNFELRGVVPGAYSLMAHVWDADQMLHGRVPLDVGAADIDGLVVPVGPGIEIHGRLQWEGPSPGKEVTPRVHLQPKEEDLYFGGGTGDVKADGRFTLKNVTDGEYRLHIFDGSEDCYIKSARLGGEDVLQGGLTVTGSKVAGALEIVLNCASGTLEGVVLNDEQQPVTEARIVLIPEGERRNQDHLFEITTPDQYGHFIMKGIAPGDYKVFAWENVEYDAYKDPDFLRRYEDAGKPVTVAEGGKLAVQLQLIPADKTQP
jgi:hypothetical protein